MIVTETLQMCPIGYWGPDCLRQSRCRVPADQQTGACPNAQCQVGYTGSECLECSEGFWGEDCVNPCQCRGRGCNIFTGACATEEDIAVVTPSGNTVGGGDVDEVNVPGSSTSTSPQQDLNLCLLMSSLVLTWSMTIYARQC